MAGEGKAESFETLRGRMVEEQIVRRGIHDERVIDAMAHVPRHEFVSDEYRDQAYEDCPLPIGEGQTISQPYIVAVALAALALQGSETVLEVGTGSGYQSAILAKLARKVFSMERHEGLARGARTILAQLGYCNVEIMVGDGSRGWAQWAPYDAIAVAAAAPRIPEALFAQLRDGGRMVIPVGPSDAQDLQLILKHGGMLAVASLNACRFVPLIGEDGYEQ